MTERRECPYINVDVFMHGNKEAMWEKGEELGLSEDALQMFKYACLEVRITLRVERETGKARIVKVNGSEVRE